MEDIVDGNSMVLELGDDASTDSERRGCIYEALSISDEEGKTD